MSDTVTIRVTQETRTRDYVVKKDFVFVASDGSVHVVKAGTLFQLPMPLGPLKIETVNS